MRSSDLLQAQMLKTMRASSILSQAVEGRIYDTERMEFPSAWVSVTATDPEGGALPLLATVHVWKRTGKQEMQTLTQEVASIFAHQPLLEGARFEDWKLDFTEVRLNEELAACRGLVRFRCTMCSEPSLELT